MVLKEKKKPTEGRSRMDKDHMKAQECIKERENVINGANDTFGGLFLVCFSI